MDKKDVAKLVEIGGIFALGVMNCVWICKWLDAECRCEKTKMCFDVMSMMAETGLKHEKKLLDENIQLKSELKKKEELLSKAEPKAEEA